MEIPKSEDRVNTMDTVVHKVGGTLLWIIFAQSSAEDTDIEEHWLQTPLKTPVSKLFIQVVFS